MNLKPDLYEALRRRSLAPRPLENIGNLLVRLGNPDRAFRSIQVAGTNGKGSVCAFIESILRSGGLSVGLFISPALTDMRERISVNGEMISEGDLLAACGEVMEAEAHEALSGFDRLTLCAALYCKKRRVDVAVFECGLGGRLDPTTALKRGAMVITRVSLDHTEVLGGTLEAIAAEKAGVLRRNVPAVIAVQESVAQNVLVRKAQEIGAPAFLLEPESASPISSDISGQTYSLSIQDYQYDELSIRLSGAHQLENAAAAVQAVQIFHPMPQSVIREGLAAARWPCRMEHFPPNAGMPGIVIDGAHNPGAAAALSGALQALLPTKLVLLFAALPEKDAEAMLELLKPAVAHVILTQFEGSRPVEELIPMCQKLHMDCSAIPLESALGEAARRCGKSSYIVVTGSLYFAGKIRQLLF